MEFESKYNSFHARKWIQFRLEVLVMDSRATCPIGIRGQMNQLLLYYNGVQFINKWQGQEAGHCDPQATVQGAHNTPDTAFVS